MFELSPLAAIIISFELTANAISNQLKVHGLNTPHFFSNAQMHSFFVRWNCFAWLKSRRMQWGASHALKIRGEKFRIFIESKTNNVGIQCARHDIYMCGASALKQTHHRHQMKRSNKFDFNSIWLLFSLFKTHGFSPSTCAFVYSFGMLRLLLAIDS